MEMYGKTKSGWWGMCPHLFSARTPFERAWTCHGADQTAPPPRPGRMPRAKGMYASYVLPRARNRALREVPLSALLGRRDVYLGQGYQKVHQERVGMSEADFSGTSGCFPIPSIVNCHVTVRKTHRYSEGNGRPRRQRSDKSVSVSVDHRVRIQPGSRLCGGG